MKTIKLITLTQMLREIDLEKNSKEDIKMVLEYIANELEKIYKVSEDNE